METYETPLDPPLVKVQMKETASWSYQNEIDKKPIGLHYGKHS